MLINSLQHLNNLINAHHQTHFNQVPLLSQINLMDCLQDYLQRNEEKQGNQMRKSLFSLKNLLKEIEDIFQVQVVIGGEQLQNLSTQQSPGALHQRNSLSYNQLKPQRDSLFARWKNNLVDITPQLQHTQSNPNFSSNGVVNSKEATLTTTTGNGYGIDDIKNGASTICLQSEQYAINNDIYRLRQILIALITNMMTWNKILNGKKPSIGEKESSDHQFDQKPLEIVCTEESNQFFEFYKIKIRLQCPNSPFMPTQETLLKYLNGVRDPVINNACRRMISTYIQLVGPYKLNAAIVEEKQIEISFDVFKDVDIMQNREKMNSQHSQSQIYSNQQCTTPPLTATKNSTIIHNNAQNLNQNSSINTNQRQQSRSQYHLTKKKKTLNVQTNSINYNIIYNNHSQIKNNTPDSMSYAQEQILQSTNRQLVDSERLCGEINENLMNSNINMNDYSIKYIQNNLQNSIFNVNSIRDSVQVGSNFPDQFTYGDQSEDCQNINRNPDLNQAIRTLFKNNSPSPLKKANPKKLQQIIPMKSKSSTNLDKLSESNISKSGGFDGDEYFNKRQSVSMKITNETAQRMKIHTITSIINNIIK